MENKHVPITKIIYDLIWVCCVGFPILILFLVVSPFNRGFYCNDESLKHPYHDSTVPSYYLYIFGLGMNVVVMIATEYITYIGHPNTVSIGRFRLPYWMWSAYNVLLVFLFGAVCSQLTTDVMKYTVGRLRPHFLTVCEPDYDCSLPGNQHKYIDTFVCTSMKYKNNERIMKEMRLSFPSGHSSFSMYAMVYFAIYLQARFTWDGSKLLRHTIQFTAIIASVFTAMTRISDYKHHWSDVLAGLSLGALVAILVARYVSTLFETPPELVDKSRNSELTSITVNGNQHQHGTNN